VEFYERAVTGHAGGRGDGGGGGGVGGGGGRGEEAVSRPKGRPVGLLRLHECAQAEGNSRKLSVIIPPRHPFNTSKQHTSRCQGGGCAKMLGKANNGKQEVTPHPRCRPPRRPQVPCHDSPCSVAGRTSTRRRRPRGRAGGAAAAKGHP